MVTVTYRFERRVEKSEIFASREEAFAFVDNVLLGDLVWDDLCPAWVDFTMEDNGRVTKGRISGDIDDNAPSPYSFEEDGLGMEEWL